LPNGHPTRRSRSPKSVAGISPGGLGQPAIVISQRRPGFLILGVLACEPEQPAGQRLDIMAPRLVPAPRSRAGRRVADRSRVIGVGGRRRCPGSYPGAPAHGAAGAVARPTTHLPRQVTPDSVRHPYPSPSWTNEVTRRRARSGAPSGRAPASPAAASVRFCGKAQHDLVLRTAGQVETRSRATCRPAPAPHRHERLGGPRMASCSAYDVAGRERLSECVSAPVSRIDDDVSTPASRNSAARTGRPPLRPTRRLDARNSGSCCSTLRPAARAGALIEDDGLPATASRAMPTVAWELTARCDRAAPSWTIRVRAPPSLTGLTGGQARAIGSDVARS